MLNTFILAGIVACGDKSNDTAIDDTDTDVTDTSSDTDTDTSDSSSYAFTNADGESSVSYSGQIFRHLLISDVKSYVGNLNTRVETEVFSPGQVEEDLLFYMDTIKDIDVSAVPHKFSTGDETAAQIYYGDISSGKNLFDKIAGNDSATDHVDWSTAFSGWTQEGVTSPESLVRVWIQELDAQAVNWTTLSRETPSVYVSSDGKDYGQLLQKFLWGAIAFSQGSDDYLDDDVQGKGLLASHIPAEDKAYSGVEHAWDEGFGYFGGAQDYGTWTDEEIAGNAFLDRNGDGEIDLKTEVNWAHSRNAGKRDNGSSVQIDLTENAWTAFWEGRKLLADTVGSELSAADLETLRGYRDQALDAWEMAIVGTVIHYINDTLKDINNEADLGDLAKHWSEAKGFALSMQFNPHSPLSDDDFVKLHDFLGQNPERTEEYETALIEARTLLGQVYGVDDANLGDENGENGW